MAGAWLSSSAGSNGKCAAAKALVEWGKPMRLAAVTIIRTDTRPDHCFAVSSTPRPARLNCCDADLLKQKYPCKQPVTASSLHRTR